MIRNKCFVLRINGDSLLAFSAYLSVFYFCLPIAMITLNSLLIRLIIVLTVFCYLMGLILKQRWKWLGAFCILFALAFLYWCVTWYSRMDSFVYPYYCFASLSFVFSGLYFGSTKNEKMIKRLFFFMTLVYFVTALTSIVGLSMYPMASREMARATAYEAGQDLNANRTVYRKLNIANWSQIYGMIFSIPVFMMIWKKTGKKRYLFMAAAILLVTITSQITFATLLAIGMIFSLFLNRAKSAKQLILLGLLFIVSIVVIVKIDFFLTLAVEFFDGIGLTFLHSKLNDLRILLTTGKSVGDAESRSTLYLRSFSTFAESPLFGVLLRRGEINDRIIGYHSEFFDLLASFGIIGVVLIGAFMILYYRLIRRIKEKVLVVIYFGFLALFVFNPVLNSPQVFIGAFLYPMIALKYCQYAEKGIVRIPIKKYIKV
ncbi:MAG: hypothetical protein K2I00_01930 [Ruminococcus sp.]|nr:hypothetical protein [Ruminococcus sp.]